MITPQVFTEDLLGRIVKAEADNTFAQIAKDPRNPDKIVAKFPDGYTAGDWFSTKHGLLQLIDIDICDTVVPELLREEDAKYMLNGGVFKVVSYTDKDAKPFLISRAGDNSLVAHSPQDLRHAIFLSGKLKGEPVGVEVKHMVCTSHGCNGCPMPVACQFKFAVQPVFIPAEDKVTDISCPHLPMLKVNIECVRDRTSQREPSMNSSKLSCEELVKDGFETDYASPQPVSSYGRWHSAAFVPSEGLRLIQIKVLNGRMQIIPVSLPYSEDSWYQECRRYNIQQWREV